jgi:hypothetical protein
MNHTLNRSASRTRGFLRCTSPVLALLSVLILGNNPARAGLGQPEASVSTDQVQMKSQDQIQNLQGYKVHQLTSTNGPTVREFVSPQGVVFGVAWQGRFAPDMNQLLGTYVTDLQTATAAQTNVRRLRGLTVKTSNLVYSNFCRMRVCTGSAYVPSLVPNNVSAGVVR